jgi:6-phosphofructokinase 1
MATKQIKRIGILTAGGDSPGLNAAIRAVGKAAIGKYGWELIGFRDGFLGLAQDRFTVMSKDSLSGILTIGGTILGTSRDKPHRMFIDGRERDMTKHIVRNYRAHRLDALVCIGGGGTHKNAMRLVDGGLRIVTLPKTIDNDVAETDATIGFETALGIASEAVDRLHSTAHSHHRIIIAEIMGHKAGWLTLGAGIAGGADVVLIPEIPYDLEKIAAAIRRRSKAGTNFSIIAVAEGARSLEDAAALEAAEKRKAKAGTQDEREYAKLMLAELEAEHDGNTLRLAKQLEGLTGLEARVTILGYVQRGGTPSFGDRLLATRLGTACVDLLAKGASGIMVASEGQGVRTVPISQVANRLKLVPMNHSWLQSARSVGTCLGD